MELLSTIDIPCLLLLTKEIWWCYAEEILMDSATAIMVGLTDIIHGH